MSVDDRDLAPPTMGDHEDAERRASAFEIPDSAYPRCVECGKPIKTQARVLFEIVGFERDRSQGGTNHVIARRRTGRMVGACCAERVQAGVDAAQGQLI